MKLKSEEEIDELINQCVDSEETGESKYHGMTYEQGIKAALEWVQGYGEHPLED